MWYLLCLIPLLLFIPGINDFFFLPGNSLSDITISHYPNMLFLKQNLFSGAGIPLWSTSILSGYPFIADPLSGMHYPPGWLALLLPLPLGFNLLTAIHLVFGGGGMFLLMKKEGIQPPVAALTGVAFGLLPKLIGHYAAGHLTLIYAVSWSPWLLLAEKCRQPRSFWQNMWRSPGVVLGIITLADPRWTFYGGLLWLVYCIRLRLSTHIRWNDIGRTILHLTCQGLLMVLIAAVLLLPFTEYVQLTTRVQMTAHDVQAISLPISGLINLIFPISGGNVEWIFHPGTVILALTIIGLSDRKMRKASLFWLVIAFIALLFSFGSLLPGFDLLSGIPGFSLLRVPPRLLFISSISLVAAGGFTLNDWIGRADGERRIQLLPLVGMLVAILVFAAGASLLAGKLVPELVFGATGLLLATIVIALFSTGHLSKFTFISLLFMVMLINLFWTDWNFMDHKPESEVLAQGSDVAEKLSKDQGFFRVYSPSYSLPQQTALKYNLQLADGVEPLQLQTYWRYMLFASGVPSTGYSVTLPEFAGGDPSHDNQSYKPDARALGLLNVRYVIAEFDLSADGLDLIDQIGSTRIYENRYRQPRTWVEIGAAVRNESEIIEYTPDQIVIDARGPGTLVLSELFYPGWQVTVDGEKTASSPYQNLIRSVLLNSGRHRIEFTFKPLSAVFGAGITVLSILILLGLGIINRNKRS